MAMFEMFLVYPENSLCAETRPHLNPPPGQDFPFARFPICERLLRQSNDVSCQKRGNNVSLSPREREKLFPRFDVVTVKDWRWFRGSLHEWTRLSFKLRMGKLT
jgi:hypothetical protein